MRKVSVVVHEDGKWLVKTEDESRTLGTHDNAQDAYKQLYAIHKSQERQKKNSSNWSVRYHMDKNNCGCDPVPSTPEEHTAKGIDLIKKAMASEDRTMHTEAHIDHHFKHGAGDFK